MTSIPRFYVYVLCRPNGKPFYVGKGTRDRIFQHDAEARKGCDCHKCRVIRKIWRNGGEIQRYKVFTTDDEQEAFSYERELIALHGRKNLANSTDGGDGCAGRVLTPKERIHRSKAQHKRYEDPNEHAKQTAVNHIRWADPEQRERLAERNRTPEMREKIRQARSRQWSDPEYRSKMRIAQGRKSYTFVSPDGNQVIVDDLAVFCREHMLDASSMVKLSKGKLKISKGWRA